MIIHKKKEEKKMIYCRHDALVISRILRSNYFIDRPHSDINLRASGLQPEDTTNKLESDFRAGGWSVAGGENGTLYGKAAFGSRV